MSNTSLHRAKSARNDEFYTLYEDIEKELSHYDVELFRGKRVYCNCDSPESNFVKYFTDNYDRLGLTGFRNTWLGMGGEGNGDFRSEECKSYLKEADIVVTNIPFSLAREYLKLMKESNKKFIFMGNANMITYKEFFAEIKDNRLWLGCTGLNKNVWFRVPHNEEYRKATARHFKIENGEWFRSLRNICWFTNLPHEKRNTPLDLVGNVYSPEKFPKYDNYAALEVAKVSEIPDRYKGVMGVPITFLDKYNPEQFEILGLMSGAKGDNLLNGNDGKPKFTVNGKEVYARILIKAKKYPKYDNYDAIEVSKVSEIPDGYTGVMGVPITFLDKYCPEQFEIVGATESEGTGVSNGLWDATSGVKQATIDGVKVYKRLFIKAKPTKCTTGRQK